MGFEPSPNRGRRVVDPDTGFWLQVIPRDVAHTQAFFDFCVEKACFPLLFDFHAEAHKGVHYYLDAKRLWNSYITTRNLYGEAQTGSWERFQKELVPLIKEALIASVLMRSGGSPSNAPKTEIIFNFEA
ncbi:MAG: hypothetical protein ACLPPF_00565 [Rhodomicrobium sp.]